MTTVAIHQPQYLPYLGFFQKLGQCDFFVALDHVQFQKNSHQNRNKIKNAQGWQWLTVPVLHNSGQAINEVQINPRVPWSRKHWQALVSNYARAPFFEAYGPELKAILDQEFDDLCSLNMMLICWAMRILEIKTPILYSSTLDVEGSKTELLVNLCQATGADCYLSGPGGKEYMDPGAFEAAGIAMIFQEFSSLVYPQLFPEAGFVPALSVVDALFNCGPETIKLLE